MHLKGNVGDLHLKTKATGGTLNFNPFIEQPGQRHTTISPIPDWLGGDGSVAPAGQPTAGIPELRGCGGHPPDYGTRGSLHNTQKIRSRGRSTCVRALRLGFMR